MDAKYNITVHAVMEWAKAELEHVGRIAAIENADIQYSYAQSTVNGMMHLRDALFELVENPDYSEKKKDLLKTHDNVVRVIKRLIRDYRVNLDEIKAFNTRHVLKNYNYVKKRTRKLKAVASPVPANRKNKTLRAAKVPAIPAPTQPQIPAKTRIAQSRLH